MLKRKSLLKNEGLQSVIASLICVLLGLLAGYIVLLFINPEGAWKAILAIIKNFFTYPSDQARLKYFGSTLVKTAPLLMCALSVLFAYKVGLFNIGVAGQYTAGIGISLYAALAWGLPWWICVLLAMFVGAILGAISGALKSFYNVNEVISGIMLNWITLYLVNTLLNSPLSKEFTSPYTKVLENTAKQALLPSLGMGTLFNNNKYVTIAIPLAVVLAVVVWVVLEKTRFGYELKATGLNKNAAKYCGMAERRNTILTLLISGALAALGAAMLYLSGYEQWECGTSSVPAMGFNGIAAAFLGGLNPIGTVLSSYFIQHITIGGAYVDKSVYSSQIADLISAIIVYLCGFVFFMKVMMKKYVTRREERLAMREAGEKGGDTT
ncbi:MAG: ABC transporter permease [Christensenellales bacterium]|jgi:ABC-type uncharacterized transport system permease subunit